MKTRVLFLFLSLVLLISTTTQQETYVRAGYAQTSGCETTPQHVRSDAWNS